MVCNKSEFTDAIKENRIRVGNPDEKREKETKRVSMCVSVCLSPCVKSHVTDDGQQRVCRSVGSLSHHCLRCGAIVAWLPIMARLSLLSLRAFQPGLPLLHKMTVLSQSYLFSIFPCPCG